MSTKFITEQKGHLTIKRPVTEATEKGNFERFLKELPKGKHAAALRKKFDKWLKVNADHLTDEEFRRAWNATVRKAEQFDDLPLDVAQDLYR